MMKRNTGGARTVIPMAAETVAACNDLWGVQSQLPSGGPTRPCVNNLVSF